MKEIHFYPESASIPDWVRYYDGWFETLEAIDHEEIIHTTQMGLLDASLFNRGFRIFIHESKYDSYEITLGDNERTDREIRLVHNLFAMWKNGEFDMAIEIRSNLWDI